MAHLTHDRLERLVFALNDDVDALARDLATLDDALAQGGTLVAYKGGRQRVAAAGALDRAWCAEHLGAPDQLIIPLAQTDAAAYLSTVVVLPPRNGRGVQL